MNYCKFQKGNIVEFEFNGNIKTGIIGVINEYKSSRDCCFCLYDIFVEAENMLYKEIEESSIKKYIGTDDFSL